MNQRIREVLQNQIEQGKRKFVIYPFGVNGKIAKKILNEEFHIHEKYVVDNVLSENDTTIKSIDYLREDYYIDDFVVLLVVQHKGSKTDIIHKQIADFVQIDRLVDVLSPSTFFNPERHYEDMQIGKDIRNQTIECISREIYKNNIKGSIAEAGVFKGTTAKKMNRYFPDRKLYLFDTFDGFDIRDQEKDDQKKLFNVKLDFTDTSVDVVLSQMIYPQNCIIKKGWFPESAEDVDDMFSFVRLDMDLYQPIYEGLRFFYPRMTKGGYIAVHDCRSKNFDGARAALIDFCKEEHLNYMCMPDELGTAVISIGF